jgi:TDG/mug DNA glycosylase family protein
MAGILPDVLAPGLRLVFCGSAAGTRSAELRQYYAHPGNKFWRTLHDVGLTPRRLAPAEYAQLLEFGIGLTDVVKDQSGPDAQIDFRRANPAALRAKIRRYAPAWLCFSSKTAAQTVLGRPVAYGVQPETLGATRLFVATSPSGRASGYWDVGPWQALSDLVKSGA